MRPLKAALLVLLAAAPCLGAVKKKGTTADSLLIGVGAQAIGMGQAYTAVADDALAFYWNPASMALVESWGVVVNHSIFMQSGALDHAAVIRGLGPFGAIGIGGQYFSAGSIDRLDGTGATLGSYTPYDMAGGAGYAVKLGPASIGVVGKVIKSRIDKTAKSQALDAGVQVPMFDGGFRLAATASNMGKSLDFGGVSEPLPKIVRTGAALNLLEKTLLISVEGGFPAKDAAYAAAGVEYSRMASYTSGEGILVSLRLGYNTINTGVKGLAGASVGIGFLMTNHMAVDYALLPMGELGVTHHLTLSYKL